MSFPLDSECKTAGRKRGRRDRDVHCWAVFCGAFDLADTPYHRIPTLACSRTPDVVKSIRRGSQAAKVASNSREICLDRNIKGLVERLHGSSSAVTTKRT